MKKRLSLVLSLVMMVSLLLTACGEGDKKGDAQDKKEEKKVEEKKVEGETVETNLFSVTFSKDWEYDKEKDLKDKETSCSLKLTAKGSEEKDAEVKSVRISASYEDVIGFRNDVKQVGTLEELFKDQTIKPVKIGDVDFYLLKNKASSELFGRIENAKITVRINVSGDVENEKVQKLFENIKFTTKDEKNVDPPMPWDGEAYVEENPLSATIGSFNLNIEQCVMDKPLILDKNFDMNMTLIGDKLYILADGKLRVYKLEGNKLTYEKDIAIDDSYSIISGSNDGTLFLSKTFNGFAVMKDEQKVFKTKDCESVKMDPSGSWGIEFYSDKPTYKVTLVDGAMTKEPITFEGVKKIDRLDISDSNILISGEDEEEKDAIYIYDLAGNLIKKNSAGEISDDTSIGSVTAMTSTANGYVVIDANFRKIMFYNSAGDFIGKLEDGDLFNTSYPWISTLAKMPDGSLLIGLGETRKDMSAKEFLVFKVSGF